MAMPSCLRLFWHWLRAAASRTFWTAGSRRPIRMAMIAITTNNSMSVKPLRLRIVELLGTRMKIARADTPARTSMLVAPARTPDARRRTEPAPPRGEDRGRPGPQPGGFPMQTPLVLLKPDCLQRRLAGAVLQRFEQKGLRLAGLKLVQPSRALAEQHYAVHKGKPFYDSLLKFLTSGPTVALVWEGREAVAVARTLMGVTDGTKAAPATIRGDFAISVQNNLVHGSDSPENAAQEIALWFKPEELVG